MTIFFSPLSFEPIKFRCEEDVKGAAYECSYFLSWINGEKKKKEQSFLLDLKSQQESEKRDDHEFWKIFFSFLEGKGWKIEKYKEIIKWQARPSQLLSPPRCRTTFRKILIYI